MVTADESFTDFESEASTSAGRLAGIEKKELRLCCFLGGIVEIDENRVA